MEGTLRGLLPVVAIASLLCISGLVLRSPRPVKAWEGEWSAWKCMGEDPESVKASVIAPRFQNSFQEQFTNYGVYVSTIDNARILFAKVKRSSASKMACHAKHHRRRLQRKK